MMLWHMFFNLRQQLEQIAEDRRRAESIRRQQEMMRALYEANEAERFDRLPVCPDAKAETDALMKRLRGDGS